MASELAANKLSKQEAGRWWLKTWVSALRHDNRSGEAVKGKRESGFQKLKRDTEAAKFIGAEVRRWGEEVKGKLSSNLENSCGPMGSNSSAGQTGWHSRSQRRSGRAWVEDVLIRNPGPFHRPRAFPRNQVLEPSPSLMGAQQASHSLGRTPVNQARERCCYQRQQGALMDWLYFGHIEYGSNCTWETETSCRIIELFYSEMPDGLWGWLLTPPVKGVPGWAPHPPTYLIGWGRSRTSVGWGWVVVHRMQESIGMRSCGKKRRWQLNGASVM